MAYEKESKLLREVQLTQLEILLELDRICKKNDIKYQLCDGTLLGAIRHKGFIPWDDDIDVLMLRKDYNRFLEVCKKDLNKKYFLQNFLTDGNFPGNISSLRKNNTLQMMNLYSDLDMSHGIWIDIFPMDNILPNTLIGQVQKFLIYKIKILKKIRIKKYAYSSRNTCLKYIKILIHNLLKPVSIQRFNKLQDKLACMFQNKETIYSTSLASGKTNPKSYYKDMIKNNDFHDTIDMEFEGHLFPVPRSYHKVLTNTFGDYMTPPPIEEQKPHHGVIEVCLDTTSVMVD